MEELQATKFQNQKLKRNTLQSCSQNLSRVERFGMSITFCLMGYRSVAIDSDKNYEQKQTFPVTQSLEAELFLNNNVSCLAVQGAGGPKDSNLNPSL